MSNDKKRVVCKSCATNKPESEVYLAQPSAQVPEEVENLRARIKEHEGMISAMLDTGAVRLIPGEPGAVAIKNPVCFSSEDAAAVARAFWRRIYPYVCSENDCPYPREFGDELPVEFQAHMTTALCALPESSAALSVAEKREWISCHERLPEIHDGDYRDDVWTLWEIEPGSYEVRLEKVVYVRFYNQIVAWMPTGLRAPEPPGTTS